MMERYCDGAARAPGARDRPAWRRVAEAVGRRSTVDAMDRVRAARWRCGGVPDLSTRRTSTSREQRAVDAGKGRGERRPSSTTSLYHVAEAMRRRGRAARRRSCPTSRRRFAADARADAGAVDGPEIATHAGAPERRARKASSRCCRASRRLLEELRADGRETDWRRRRTRRAAAATQAVGAGATPAEDNRISIDEFMKVELRVAKVLEAEAVPKSKKLVKLKVDVGDRAANDRRRHRGGVSTRAAGRPDDRHRRSISSRRS